MSYVLIGSSLVASWHGTLPGSHFPEARSAEFSCLAVLCQMKTYLRCSDWWRYYFICSTAMTHTVGMLVHALMFNTRMNILPHGTSHTCTYAGIFPVHPPFIHSFIQKNWLKRYCVCLPLSQATTWSERELSALWTFPAGTAELSKGQSQGSVDIRTLGRACPGYCLPPSGPRTVEFLLWMRTEVLVLRIWKLNTSRNTLGLCPYISAISACWWPICVPVTKQYRYFFKGWQWELLQFHVNS